MLGFFKPKSTYRKILKISDRYIFLLKKEMFLTINFSAYKNVKYLDKNSC